MRRFWVVLAVVSILAAGFVLSVPGPAAALSATWTSDADFAGGTFLLTEVVGTGTAAVIQLALNPMYNWIQKFPAIAPTPRRGGAMTYDERNGVLLAFGGAGAGAVFHDDLWAYNESANTWTRLATGPPARWKAGFSYDPTLQAAILYGGLDARGVRIDLWRYYVVNNTWLQVPPPPMPPRNLRSTPLVYDISARRHILVATNDLTDALQTWAYDAPTNQWTNRAPPSPVPPPTEGHTLTYDRTTQKTVLFGGAHVLELYGDLWEYDSASNTWFLAVQYTPNVTPNKRTDHAMAFGPHGGESLMIGGIEVSGAYQPETWTYTSAPRSWGQPVVTLFPAARKDHTLAWDAARDRIVMFGGIFADGTVTNETWVWGPGYFSSGTWESTTTFDAGCAAPTWRTLWWNATRPPTTTARFKIATSNAPDGPFVFRGWDGLPGTYYNGTPGQVVWAGHNRPPDQRYFRWKLALTTGSGTLTPALDDFTVVFDCSEQLPYIVSTSPAYLASWVQETAPIVVTFNVPMNASTVAWTFSDPTISFTSSWSPDFTVLTLTHSTRFRECDVHSMEILGKDQRGTSLVPGPVPNPWTFSTGCFTPKVVRTVPADGDFNVALDAVLVATFSEPMDTPTVTWSITGGIPLTGSWDASETNLTLSHATPFTACTSYTARIVSGRDKAGLSLTAGPVPNPWSFSTTCPNPYIARTDPRNGATQVPGTAPIVVTFSKPMDAASVNWTISPLVALTRTWSAGDTVLTLDHTAPFLEFARYTVNITSGREKGGLLLVPGPVPNPWSFSTAGVRPNIVQTVPASAATGVPLDAAIVVTFSERMDTPTVAAAISPPVTLAKSWNSPTDTVLTLTHAAPFELCTDYTVNVTGKDLQGFSLVAGPVPNPWTFSTACPLLGPGHLRVSMAGPDVQLSWDPVIGATVYRVYSAQDRFASWPWPVIGTTPAPPFLATGHGSDLQTHYYVVRAANATEDGPNSTMGVKTALRFTLSTVNTNIAWFSLPYASDYRRASDIATALGPANIDVVGKWVPATQSSLVYYYARGRWQGTDFTVDPGDGLYLGIRQAFMWNVTGTDATVALSFTWNPPPRANVNWVGLPYTGVYQRASDIATALGSTRITEVGLWNPVTQTVTRYYWTGSAWAGTDFTIPIGAGTYVIIVSSFTWSPQLITPTVP